MESIDQERFGHFLSKLRKEKGFTQQEVADRLFVSNKAVSKWERGQSLPDINRLNPLAQLLDISVAELLKGERMTQEALDNSEAETLVSQISAEEGERRRRSRKFWRWTWVICAALAALETMLLITLNRLSAVELWDYLLLVEGLTLGFGGYFCFFGKETLPSYYDQNRISAYSDGIFRMNLPGVHLNNSNWPHVVKTARGWLLGTAVLWPPVFALGRALLPPGAMLGLALLSCLSFFLPMTIVGKKYE